jgi:hypothetical protein
MEQVLQRTLVEHADDAPWSGELLQRVRVRHRRRYRRQFVAVAGGLAVALCAAVLGLRGWTTGVALEPAGPPPATAPAPTPVRFTAGPLTLPSFPYRPEHALPGLKAPVVSLVGGEPTLRYEGSEAGPRYLTVSVATGALAPAVDGRSYSVHKRLAVFTSATPDLDEWTLRWSEGDRTITLRGSGPVDVTALIGYADGLVPAQLPIVAAFTFASVPANLTVADAEPSWVTFRPDNVPADGSAEHRLAVLLQDTMPAPGDGRARTVGGSAAVLWHTAEGTMLAIKQPAGGALVVQVPSNLPVDEGDLVAFAAGIRVTAAAVPGQG